MVVGSQYALRLEQAQGSGNQRARFAQARNLVLEDLTSRLRDAGHDHSVLHRLSLDNASLLRDRIPPAAAVNLLLSAWMMNPVMPYDIKLSEDVRHEALEKLALDVNVKSDWAVVISDAELKARAVHKAGLTSRRAAFAVAGAAALVAAPMLVVVAAPAGLAGGAAIVAGLAALGPGGMLGGLGIVGLIGGAGGAMAAQALVSGSAAQVEETVIYLQAFAKASHELDQAPAGYPSWTALVAMEDAVTDEHARVSRLSDSGAQMVKELEQKMRSIRRAIDWMVENSLSPVAILPPTSNS